MQILHLIFPLAIYRTVCSSPVPPNAINSRAELPLLVLFLTFVSLLFVLFVIKWFYVFRRRQPKSARGSRTTLRPGWYDNFSTSSSRFGKLFMGSGDVKSGFLIGLLGSPSWETRYSAVIVEHRSPRRDPTISSRETATGLSLCQGSKSCSSICCGSAHSPVPEENITLINSTGPLSSPPPAATNNRSPLLFDTEYMRFRRISAALSSGTTSLVNSSSCTQGLCRPCVPKAPSSSAPISSCGTNQAEYFVGRLESNLVTNPPSDLWSTEQETQKPLESFSVAFSFPNLVPRSESTLTSINEHSCNSTQSAGTTPKPFTPSLRSTATQPTKHFPSLSSYRRSPKIGPSPLRTMILPPIGYPDSFQTLSNNRRDYLVRPTAHGTIDIDPVANLVLDRAMNVRLASTPGPTKSADADSLLDLMSELAHETSAWDPNVFMDENFKKLIGVEHSKPQSMLKEPLTTVRSRRPSRRSSRHRKVQHMFTTLEDIPEVDVTEMMPALTGHTSIHSFWSDEDDDRQFLIS